ncbi:heavy metal translocating P-type ATPase metal-binding domain-containing protein [Halobacteriovorax sp. GB3]|uniref:heavy metal translocating P-type ATPase n=1 Tax=Halobacteriovorax sp. GB3 TaxID=2719615 RepID=UPI00236131CC|nr:heavy metal translocating P-type ATPase [Halobacteriovorax sp. GB3]MDD0853395.1 heavy metal translocating P-type ATPase metal-binding domain-containing protein [Halobacteriovorax sp. GB3]
MKEVVVQKIQCKHCEEETLNPLFNQEDTQKLVPFCCNGCRAVYNLLNEKGLSQYYNIKEKAQTKGNGPVELAQDKFSYLNDKDFINDFCLIQENGDISVDFYLEGVHCLACLWLIEKTPEFIPSLRSARLDLGKQVATFVVKKDHSLSEVASEVSKLGYRPHPLKKGGKIEKLKRLEERKTLLKIGVAGACAGNAMLYAVGLYAGADGLFAKYFEYITFLFSLPVLLYSATPFYQGARSALKRRTLSIDVPVAFALWLAFTVSLVHLIQGSGEIYFDSIATLVFLLLLSRYFMKKASQKGLEAGSLGHFFNSGQVLRKDKDSGKFISTHAKYLKAGDIIRVLEQEMIPADGIILEGSGQINSSLLTGESLSQKVKAGDEVFSGTENLVSDLIIKVQKAGEHTRVGEILKEVEKTHSQKAPIVSKADIISKYFVGIVLFLAIATVGYFAFSGDINTGISRALALIIISCPCALGLATPLAMTKSLSKASELGIIIKDETILEKIGHLKNMVIDKTGTLTRGKFSVVKSELSSLVDSNSQKLYASLVYTLERKSKHPLARALCDFIEREYNLLDIEVLDYEEIIGKGVQAQYEGDLYQVRTVNESDRSVKDISTQVGLYKEDKLLWTFSLCDQLRSDAKSSLTKLKAMNVEPLMASGDHHEVVEAMGRELGLSSSKALSELSPEAKAKLIESMDSTIMVGDGANDALALGKADLGIAVQGSVDISLRAADAYLTKAGIAPILNLIILSKETLSLINRNLAFSLAYNAFGAYAAMVGWVSPLWAAFFMPASSLTVLFSTIYGTRTMKRLTNNIQGELQ